MTEQRKASGPPPSATALAPPTAGELAVADTERPPEKASMLERTGTLKPAEVWALEKGHIVNRPDGSRDLTAPNLWRFRAAQAGGNWPEGLELTEAEYDGAVAAAEKVEVR